MPVYMKIRSLLLVLPLAGASRPCWGAGDAGRAAKEAGAPDAAKSAATFPCADTLRRADGRQESTTCVLAREYCYEASGGAAVSHGAHCRPLPKANATCIDVASGPGSSCTGTPETGIFSRFAYP